MKSIAHQLREYIETTHSLVTVLGAAQKGTTAAIIITRVGMQSAGAFDDSPDAGDETILIQSVYRGLDKNPWDNLNLIHDSLFPTATADFTGTFVSGGRTVKAVHDMGSNDIDADRLPEDDVPWFGCEMKVLIQHQA